MKKFSSTNVLKTIDLGHSNRMRMRLKGLYFRIQEASFQFQLARLWLERAFRKSHRKSVIATACWDFPIYSQTFVYQELTQLMQNGFDLRFLYSKMNSRNHLPEVFVPLWQARRKFILNSQVCLRAYERYKKRLPDKTNALIEILCSRSGLSREQLFQERHFFQAFAFTEMVEAYRPDYIHSYFFYEGSLFALVASFLLDIPRGVSCYSDHMLKDYVLKVVPLHLEQCSLVIATSEQIKAELLKINPLANSEKIIVKSNAIHADHFPFRERAEPENAQPFRLITVSRIDPKKGLVYLLQAIRYLRDENLNVEAHIIGGVDNHRISRQYAIEVENKIKQLDLSDVVHLEGTRTQKEVQRFLAEGHLFVAPFIETESGDKDGIPTSLMEAMASGMPVITTDAGSIAEVVENGVNGQIVQQKNYRALGNALKELLLEPEKRRSFGSRASHTIRSQFDVRNSEKIFHDRLDKLLEGKVKTNGF